MHNDAYLRPKALFILTHKSPKSNSTQLVQIPVPSSKKIETWRTHFWWDTEIVEAASKIRNGER